MTSTAAGEHWDKMYETAVRSAWTQNPLVERELYMRMTGQAGFWLEWVFTQQIPPVGTLLSVGCGDGNHELFIARRGFAKKIVAFDASEFGIGLASDAARAENLAIDFSVRRFEDFVSEPATGGIYDAVLFAGSLHHVTDLEGMLAKVRHVLKPGGRVIMNEYVGPCYQLYPATQVKIVNDILGRIGPEFRLGADEWLVLPTIETIMDNDPTEGVRSALIPTLISMYFRPEYERVMAGGLLHPIFGYLNGTKVNDGSPESSALVSTLIAAEVVLTSNGVLANDFMFGIYRNP